MKKILFNLIILTAFFVQPAYAVVMEFDGHFYERNDTFLSWHDAETYAESEGGHLATIGSQAEQDFIWSNFQLNGTVETFDAFIWLGGTDEVQEGVWKWVTGETFWIGPSSGHPVNNAFTYWTDDNPSDTGTGQDYLAFFPASWNHGGQPNLYGWWDDFGPPDYTGLQPSIIEWDSSPTAIPEPASSTLFLLGIGAMALKRYRRKQTQL